MNEPNVSSIAPHHAATSPIATLFTWRGSGIVLIGTRENDRWILARAWLEDDRLEHVRRWSFAQPISYSRQVRRLIMEATGNVVLARDEALQALAWAEAAS
ncbi:MAG: hypothetical protein K0S14_1853 [Thermomicrobiales bacterium]|jgi:hypothetical protein|nr:hypothetical protein [Thermomicrobiales bacterium]MCD6059003.1 hypothetical protein [Thermomicrobiales bacterium]MDF2758644.1 hypothetical protein [Thermomicrobiales bacterium]